MRFSRLHFEPRHWDDSDEEFILQSLNSLEPDQHIVHIMFDGRRERQLDVYVENRPVSIEEET